MRRLELHEAYTHLMLLETKLTRIILTLTSGEQKFWGGGKSLSDLLTKAFQVYLDLSCEPNLPFVHPVGRL